MTVSCPDCTSVFRVDPAKVPATGVRARCSVCGGVITLGGGTLPISVTPSVVTPNAASLEAEHARAVTAQGPSSTGWVAPLGAPQSTHAPLVARSQPSATSDHPTGRGVSDYPPAADFSPAKREALVPPSPEGATPTARMDATAPAASAEGKRPINPFLRADPAQRAHRLARALVSDLVAYHPQKRDEGLRDGTLRQLFREEIKKSYEEYVEQVGQEVATNAPYFQDALNDVLAGGRRLF
jgi:predicted Zn finger-like uncharacterized protein